MHTLPAEWPQDVDGDVFRNMQESGFDFSQQFDIEFIVDLETWPPSEAFLNALQTRQPRIKVYEPDEYGDGYVMFIVHAQLTYDLVMSVQKEISEFAAPYGGVCDSWGVMQQ